MAQPRSRIGQEEDDVEICRVCRSGATPEQPLFHPCKCSGSMKFVHQDCLEEWLQHSRNKHCEICNHKFSFTSLYADDVPDNISFLFFLSVLFQKLSKAVTLYLRVLLAITVWLVAVPYMTAWIWRCYFSPAIVLQRTVAGRTIRTVLGGMALSGSSTAIYLNSTLPGGLEGENWHSSFQGVVADLFEGQIITAVAVIVGLALLCLKEYIVMNTPVDAEGRPVNPAPAGAELHADHVDLQARPPQAAPQPGDARAEADLNGIQREEVDSDDDNDDNIDGDNHGAINFTFSY
ncbi:RING-variant domain-containing protein [Cladochytrium replicatum]|nr:RING-variant domain-containing protein [Cladochytrium replicatum]